MVAAGLYCVHTVMWVCPYHPEHHVDGQHGGHASERQALQDAAAGVGAEASLGGAVLLPERVQEAQNIQLRGSAPPRERPARRQLGLRHQHRVIPDVRGGGGKRRGEKEACGGRGRGGVGTPTHHTWGRRQVFWEEEKRLASASTAKLQLLTLKTHMNVNGPPY